MSYVALQRSITIIHAFNLGYDIYHIYTYGSSFFSTELIWILIIRNNLYFISIFVFPSGNCLSLYTCFVYGDLTMANNNNKTFNLYFKHPIQLSPNYTNSEWVRENCKLQKKLTMGSLLKQQQQQQKNWCWGLCGRRFFFMFIYLFILKINYWDYSAWK